MLVLEAIGRARVPSGLPHLEQAVVLTFTARVTVTTPTTAIFIAGSDFVRHASEGTQVRCREAQINATERTKTQPKITKRPPKPNWEEGIDSAESHDAVC